MGLSLNWHSKERGGTLETCPLSGWGRLSPVSLRLAGSARLMALGTTARTVKKRKRSSSRGNTLPPSHQFRCRSLNGPHLEKSLGCCSRSSQCQPHQPSDTDTGLAVSPVHAGVPPNQLVHSRCRKASPTWKQEFGPSSTVTWCLSGLQTSSLQWPPHLKYPFPSYGPLWPQVSRGEI